MCVCPVITDNYPNSGTRTGKDAQGLRDMPKLGLYAVCVSLRNFMHI